MPYNDDQRAAPYHAYTYLTEYFGDTGTILMPVAAPTTVIPGSPGSRPSAEVAQVSAPFGWLRVEFVGFRDGAPCKAPIPSNNPNLVLKTWRCKPGAPQILEDGITRRYQISGEYLYFLLQPIWLLDGLPMGTMPYDDTPGGNYTPDLFYQEPTPASSGGSGGNLLNPLPQAGNQFTEQRP